ncbi:MAG: DUF3048 domain-containing protein [Eubacteriales bacterium]
MASKTSNRKHIAARLKTATAAMLALAALLSGCSIAPFFAPSPTPTEAGRHGCADAATDRYAGTNADAYARAEKPLADIRPRDPRRRAEQGFILSIDNANGAKPQTSLMQADIVYEFLAELQITRFQAVFNDTYPLYAGPVRSARYYFIDLAQEWDCMYLHVGYVLLAKPYRRIPANHISLYLPGGDFSGYNANYYERQGALDDFETKNGYKFRAPETTRGNVHALYFRIAALVDRYFVDYESQVRQRFDFQENISYENGEAFSIVSLPFDNRRDPQWVQFTYDPETNRIYRSEGGEPTMTRTLIDADGSYITEQMNVQNLIVQYVDYGTIKGDTKYRRSCDLFGSGKCDYFINGQHVSGTWSRPTAEDYTTYLLDDGTLVTLEPGNTWIAVHPADDTVTIE